MTTQTSLFEAVQSYIRSKQWSERAKDNLELAVQTYQHDLPTLTERTGHFAAKLRGIQAELIRSGKRIQKYKLEDYLQAEEIAEFNTITKMLGPFSKADILSVQQGTIFHTKENVYYDINYSNSIRIGVTGIGMAAGLLISAFTIDFKEVPEFKYFIGTLAGLFGLVGISSFLPYERKNHLPSLVGILEERAAYIQKHMPGGKNEF